MFRPIEPLRPAPRTVGAGTHCPGSGQPLVRLRPEGEGGYNPRHRMKRTLKMADRVVEGVTVLDLQGRLVLDEADFFRRRIEDLIRENRLKIVLNLEDVTYIDSAGIGMMVGKYLSVRREGGDVKLLHLSPRTTRVMTITKLMTVFETFESEEQAVRSFAQNP